MIEHLNLKDDDLVYQRKKLIGGIEKELGPSKDASDDVGEIIATWRLPDSAGRLAGFAQVAYRYLEDETKHSVPC